MSFCYNKTYILKNKRSGNGAGRNNGTPVNPATLAVASKAASEAAQGQVDVNQAEFEASLTANVNKLNGGESGENDLSSGLGKGLIGGDEEEDSGTPFGTPNSQGSRWVRYESGEVGAETQEVIVKDRSSGGGNSSQGGGAYTTGTAAGAGQGNGGGADNVGLAGTIGDPIRGGAKRILDSRGAYMPRGQIYGVNKEITIRTPIANINSNSRVLNYARVGGKVLVVAGVAATGYQVYGDIDGGRYYSAGTRAAVFGVAAGAAFIPVVGWGVSAGIGVADYIGGDQFYNYVENQMR